LRRARSRTRKGSSPTNESRQSPLAGHDDLRAAAMAGVRFRVPVCPGKEAEWRKPSI
jgi:hypothetical protein